MLPNQDQIQGIARWGVSVAAGYVIGKGWLTQEQVLDFLPYVMGLAPLIWGLFVHKKAATVARAADIVPITAASQASVGITQPQLVPTSPKATP